DAALLTQSRRPGIHGEERAGKPGERGTRHRVRDERGQEERPGQNLAGGQYLEKAFGRNRLEEREGARRHDVNAFCLRRRTIPFLEPRMEDKCTCCHPPREIAGQKSKEHPKRPFSIGWLYSSAVQPRSR